MRMNDNMFLNEQLKFLSKCTDLGGNPKEKYKQFLHPTNIHRKKKKKGTNST